MRDSSAGWPEINAKWSSSWSQIIQHLDQVGTDSQSTKEFQQESTRLIDQLHSFAEQVSRQTKTDSMYREHVLGMPPIQGSDQSGVDDFVETISKKLKRLIPTVTEHRHSIPMVWPH